MARIVVNCYMVRYPLGGSLSWALQWLVGFHRLGHEVYMVEKSGYPGSCFDVGKRTMGDDCTYGVGVVKALLERFGLGERWCYVDAAGRSFGLSRAQVRSLLRSADLYLDFGTHGLDREGTWLEEADGARLRVLIATEPGATQMRMAQRLAAGGALPEYDAYYTTGLNIGTCHTSAPTAGRTWRPIFDPVVVELFPRRPLAPDAPFSTVMNWQSHEPIEFQGIRYGQKDAEFAKFMDLPMRTKASFELAVAGKRVPFQQLQAAGWRVRPAHEVTASVDSYHAYIAASKGEFSVCKQVCVATNSGWFSDRGAAYLASGRPVVMQDTGFSRHLPCGRGLFAVRTVEEAAAAIREIAGGWTRHSAWARELACEYLDTRKVLPAMLGELGAAMDERAA